MSHGYNACPKKNPLALAANYVIPEKLAKYFFTGKAPSNAVTIRKYRKDYVFKFESSDSASLHSAMKQMLAMFKDMEGTGLTLGKGPQHGVMAKIDEEALGFQLIFKRNLLQKVGDNYMRNIQGRLLDIGCMFNYCCDKWNFSLTDPVEWKYQWRMSQPEHYFFRACCKTTTLDQLWNSPYIQSDPETWSFDEWFWEKPMRKWAFCTEIPSGDEDCECDVCTALYDSDAEKFEGLSSSKDDAGLDYDDYPDIDVDDSVLENPNVSLHPEDNHGQRHPWGDWENDQPAAVDDDGCYEPAYFWKLSDLYDYDPNDYSDTEML